VTRAGLTVPLHGLPLAAHADWLRELQDLGYTDLWSAEVGGNDAFTPLAVAAEAAPWARLGTAIAGVFTRGPALLAMQAASLAEAAPGRFVLGLGASSPAIVEDWNAGSFERPLARVRDTIRFLRRVLRGERVDESYETFAVHGFRLERPPAEAPPIYLAALRERMLQLAAREADGAILGLVTVDDVRRVASIARADQPGLDLVVRIGVVPSADAERCRAQCRRVVAAYMNAPAYAGFHQWMGRGDTLAPIQRAWRAGDRAAAVAAVPDWLADGLFVHGSPASCRDKIAAFVDAGITTPVISIMPFGGDLRQAARELSPSATT